MVASTLRRIYMVAAARERHNRREKLHRVNPSRFNHREAVNARWRAKSASKGFTGLLE